MIKTNELYPVMACMRNIEFETTWWDIYIFIAKHKEKLVTYVDRTNAINIIVSK